MNKNDECGMLNDEFLIKPLDLGELDSTEFIEVSRVAISQYLLPTTYRPLPTVRFRRNLQFAICNFQFTIRLRPYLIILILMIPFWFNATPILAQGRAGQGGADLGRQLKQELGPAAEKEDQNPLIDVARRMSQVRQRILQADTGPATLGLQKQIVEDLDRLIDEACKSAGSGMPGTSSLKQPSDSEKADSLNSKAIAKAGQKPGDNPAVNSAAQKPDSSQSTKYDLDQRRALVKEHWGELPPQVREQILQAPAEEFVPKYEQLIEDYYRQLSTDKKTGE
jgi:hypothetical protein